MENNGNLENKVEHILISKTKIIYSILAVIFSIGVPVIIFFFTIERSINDINLNIELIKQNHETHIQTALEKIANLEKQEVDLMNKLDKDHEAIIELMTIHPTLKK